MIKEAKFFLQELIEVERRNFLLHRQVVQLHTAAPSNFEPTLCLALLYASNILFPQNNCESRRNGVASEWCMEQRSHQTSLMKKEEGAIYCLQRCQFVQQKTRLRLTRPNKSISSCNNCPTLGTLLSSPCPLHQIMLTLATSTRRDKYLLKWTSNRNWIKHSFRQVIKSPFLLLIITDP